MTALLRPSARYLARGFAGAAAALLFAIALAAVPPAAARDLTASERSALAGTVARFDQAMRRKTVPVIIDIIPPRVVAHIAARHGVDPAKLRGVMIQQTQAVMNAAVIVAFRMEMARARYGATPDGTPYALVPTSTTLRIDGRETEKRSNSLAMMDGGRWYLLDLNQPSRVAIFTEVYPEFRGVPLGGQAI